jgi:hypothetical protein
MKQNRKGRKIFHIIKSSGRPEEFSKKKLLESIKHTGLPTKTCQKITDKVAVEINEGEKTKNIYKKALTLVAENSRIAAAQYSLKRALFELGPSGHNFEHFVSRYFEAKGFKTKVGKVIPGKFVKHEVDVVASKKGYRYFVECKFHNRQGRKNDIKVALYVKARWDDLKNGPDGKGLRGFFLASNTAFTLDAITYAAGTGLKLLGVNVPTKCSFLEEVKQLKLYPITSLKRINKLNKQTLLSLDFYLAKELLYQYEVLYRIGMTEREIDLLMLEIEQLIE